MDLFDVPPKPSVRESYIFPLLGLALIVMADRNIDSVILTPLLSICLLGLLAFRLETKALTFWFVILTCNVVLALIYPVRKTGGDINLETVVVRSLGFVVSGSLALAMNKSRFRLIRNHRDLLEMLERMPCAVVVSDSVGALLFSNKKAIQMLGKNDADVIGLSFFTFFTSPEQRGHAIQSYLHLIEQEVPHETNLSILVDSKRRQNAKASQIPINLISQKCIVSVIESDFETASYQSEDSPNPQEPGPAAAVV